MTRLPYGTPPPHPTCIDVTSIEDAIRDRQTWCCGVDCPTHERPAAFAMDGTAGTSTPLYRQADGSLQSWPSVAATITAVTPAPRQRRTRAGTVRGHVTPAPDAPGRWLAGIRWFNRYGEIAEVHQLTETGQRWDAAARHAADTARRVRAMTPPETHQ